MNNRFKYTRNKKTEKCVEHLNILGGIIKAYMYKQSNNVFLNIIGINQSKKKA